MARSFTAHDLADYARCPRAWWFERHHHLAKLGEQELAGLLAQRRAQLGARAAQDAEVAVLERLIERHARFAHGIAAHQADAVRSRVPAPWGRLALAAALLILALILVLLLWR
jgi:hypothetical protein